MSDLPRTSNLGVTEFDRDAFEAQLRQAFYTYKRALGEFKPAICRQVMTDDLWEQVKAQVARLQSEGLREVAERVDVTAIKLLSGASNGYEDSVVADVSLSGVDYISVIATGDIRGGTRDARQWTERWTLQRSRDPEVLEAAAAPRCPYCGAPLQVDPDGNCTFCRATVPGPRNAWLVAGIAAQDGPQEAAAPPDPMSPLAGLMDRAEAVSHQAEVTGRPLGTEAGADAGIRAIKAHDAEFNPIDFAARARDIFMAILQARATIDPRRVRPFLADDFWAEESQRLKAARASRHNTVRAYLDVTSLDIVEADSRDGWDWLVVRVASTAAEHEVDLDSEEVLGGADTTRLWTDRMTFRRADTCQSSAVKGFMAGRCPACEAPAEVQPDGRCVRCRRHITGGELDWVLSGIETKPG